MDRKREIAIVVVLFAVLPVFPLSNDTLHRTFDKLWEFELSVNPLFASRIGYKEFDDKLPDRSIEAIDRIFKVREDFYTELLKFQKLDLKWQDKISLFIALRYLDARLAEYKFGAHFIPITSRGGFHVSFAELPLNSVFETRRDLENFLKRMEAFPKYVDQNIKLMEEGLKRGITLPKTVLQGYEESISYHLDKKPEETVFFKPFKKFNDEQLNRRAIEVIKGKVIPSYRRFYKFFVEKYYPSCRSSVGVSALPGGKDFYLNRIKYFTTLDISPEDIHKIGMEEVEKLKKQMSFLAKELTGKDLKGFIQFLRDNDKFYPKTPRELLEKASFYSKRIDGRLPELFELLPRMPYGIKEIPLFIAPKTTVAYYMPPSGDGKRGGFYYLNTYDLRSRPLYNLEALTYHEAVPGHHLQIALQQELKGLPKFRRFWGVGAFVEGWALYAEGLGKMLGFYEDPYSEFGRLTFSIWRAARLVVDTGIHYMGWSRQKAIKFMEENTALAKKDIINEVDRYISWPGQALGYKIGEIYIKKLRDRAKEELGDKFDIRRFHKAVLEDGSLPLELLNKKIDRWIGKLKEES